MNEAPSKHEEYMIFLPYLRIVAMLLSRYAVESILIF